MAGFELAESTEGVVNIKVIGTGGGVPGAPLAKSEWRGCALKSVCLRGAALRGFLAPAVSLCGRLGCAGGSFGSFSLPPRLGHGATRGG